MPRLLIQLLGPFNVIKDDQPIIFPYDKMRALLAYLVFESGLSGTSGSPISRTRLASLLWPDQPQIAAQDSLRQALSRLRSLIDDRNTLPPFLLVERETIQLNRASSIQVDLDEFQDAIAKVALHPHRSLSSCPICTAQLEVAARLVRGDFLEDLSLADSDLFENWATFQRERINFQVLELLGELARFYEHRGDPGRTLAYAARLIQIDPYHEPAHRQMMQALVRSDQRSQAVLHFNRLKQLLEDELGILPEAETLALFETIRQGHNLPADQAAHLHNLPTPLGQFVGRTVELSELSVWLSDANRRLISLVGPGGVGKTRLAIQAAHQVAGMFSDGVVYVTLSRTGVATPTSTIGSAIAGALGLAGAEDSWLHVLDVMRSQEVLLVLDGFEHIPKERERIAELLEVNARLVILTTTRHRLDLPGEWVFGLGGLDVPPIYLKSQLGAYSAVALFCQCASQVNQSFELNEVNQASIGEICRMVEGLPLAIRLSGAWVRSLSCSEIALEIRHSLDILTSQVIPGTDDKQSSVRAVFEQSWNWLARPDQEVFSRLSVFRSGFDRLAAEHVAGATFDILAHLVDQSVLRMSPEGRYDLHDLLSQFGAEKLQQAGGETAVRQRHFDWYFSQAERNEKLLNSDDRLNAFIWLIREMHNLSDALIWAQGNVPERAGQLARWMHSDFHQTGMHIFAQQKRPSF